MTVSPAILPGTPGLAEPARDLTDGRARIRTGVVPFRDARAPRDGAWTVCRTRAGGRRGRRAGGDVRWSGRTGPRRPGGSSLRSHGRRERGHLRRSSAVRRARGLSEGRSRGPRFVRGRSLERSFMPPMAQPAGRPPRMLAAGRGGDGHVERARCAAGRGVRHGAAAARSPRGGAELPIDPTTHGVTGHDLCPREATGADGSMGGRRQRGRAALGGTVERAARDDVGELRGSPGGRGALPERASAALRRGEPRS